MVDYKYAELYQQNSVDKQLNIVFDGGEITNTDIHSEQFELTESICSDSQLRFGSCEASVVKFRISNIFTPLKDKWLTVTETLNHNVDTPFQFGFYKVYSDTPTADRRYRDVVAYDKMYDIINIDLTEWYNSLFPTDDTEITLKEFRTSLMNYLGVEQEDVTLVNDNMVVSKTIQPTQLAGGYVVSAICEINGCFGHIGRDGKFHYVFLAKRIQGLYPANDLYPKDDLFPREQITNKIDKSLYIDCKYEDYLSQKITKIQIRQEENDIGKTYPDGNVTDNDNVYSVTDNFLVYGKEETELEDIAKKLYSVIYGTEYRPYEAEVVGNPCLEVGDAIRFNTSYQIVESYILKRTLRGVQGLRDELSADGEEYLSENASGIESQIQQIKGKSNVLERNIDETVSKISDVEQGLKSEIKQTANEITQNVSETYETKQSANETKSTLESQIKQTSDSITSTVSKQITETKQYADNVASNAETNAKNDTTEKLKSYSTTTEMNSAIEQTAKSITSAVAKTYETKTDAGKMKKELQSSIEQTAQNITQTVSTTYETKTDASATKKELSSQIEQTADSINQTIASSQSKWSTVTSDGAIIPISEYGYGLDGTITGSSYIFSDTLNVGDIYLDQETGYGWECTSISSIDEKRVALFGYRPKHTFNLITDELSSQIEQMERSIVLKVDANGKIVEVSLSGDPESGTEFTVLADNISLSASEVIDMLTDGDINLTGKNISITSDNFNVDSYGNMSCENANVNGDITAQTLWVNERITMMAGAVEADMIKMFYNSMHGTGITIGFDGNNNVDIMAVETHVSGSLDVEGGISTPGSVNALNAIISGTTTTYSLYSTRAKEAETTAKTNCYISTEGLISKTSTTSSKRFKDNITEDIEKELDPNKLYDIKVVQFKYKKDYFKNKDDIRYRKNLIGFIAEDIYEKYPIAADFHYEDDGKVVVDTWNEQYLIPPMIKLIQDQKKEIDNMRLEINELKRSVSFLMQKIGGRADE